jgi:Protein of unknown function (DUF4054)
MTAPAYNDSNFRQMFPEFENTTDYSEAQLEGWWTMGTAYINILNAFPTFSPAQLQLSLDLMCAHLAKSFTMINAGIPTVVVQGTSEGTVNVSMTPPPVKSSFGWWLATTPYGAQLRALLKTIAGVGLFVGGSPENLGFRRAGGFFGNGIA